MIFLSTQLHILLTMKAYHAFAVENSLQPKTLPSGSLSQYTFLGSFGSYNAFFLMYSIRWLIIYRRRYIPFSIPGLNAMHRLKWWSTPNRNIVFGGNEMFTVMFNVYLFITCKINLNLVLYVLALCLVPNTCNFVTLAHSITA